MEELDPPTSLSQVQQGTPKPDIKPKPDTLISPKIAGLRTDDAVEQFLASSKDSEGGLALVKFGSSWCSHCREIFPDFLKLTTEYPNAHYAVAQIDYLTRSATHVEYTPTFTFYRSGRRVDQLFGVDMDKLKDRIWLHHD